MDWRRPWPGSTGCGVNISLSLIGSEWHGQSQLEEVFWKIWLSHCFRANVSKAKGNDFLKRMMMFLRCYGWIYFPLSLFLFRVFCGVSSQTDLVSHKGFKNWECWLVWHWYCWYQFSLFPFYLSFFWVVALGRQFTEPLSADAALSSLCGAKRPAQYKSNPDQKWISNVVTKF